MAEWQHSRRTPLLWWLLAAGVAVALKAHFSAAAASGLVWMLRPLALMVQLVGGWRFTPTADGEWQSLGAGVVLVKACAGINFMILSFLGWCWWLRPRPRETAPGWSLCLEWPLLLLGALALAWSLALAVNTLRIVAVVRWQPALERWLSPAEAHRTLGLLAYLPALSLQLVLAERRRWRGALLAGCTLYAAMLLFVPVATGHALAHPLAFGAHALRVLAALAPILLLALWRRPRPESSGADTCYTVGPNHRGGLPSCHCASLQPPCLLLPPDARCCNRPSPRAPHSHCHRSPGLPAATTPARAH